MDLKNYIKYCYEYIKLTRTHSIVLQNKHSIELNKDNFNLPNILKRNFQTDNNGELINLPFHYNNENRNNEQSYNEEKEIVKIIEDIYNKYRNDQFRKQIILSFGYFEYQKEIEIYEIENEEEIQNDVDASNIKIINHYLFSIPVKIEKKYDNNYRIKYYIVPTDTEIQVNIGILEDKIDQNYYYDIIREIGQYEKNGKLTLPITEIDNLNGIWNKIVEIIRPIDNNFNSDSFILDKTRITLANRTNYFLAEDLKKLSDIDENSLNITSLSSWINDEELDIHSQIPQEGQLYFPFHYDNYQLKVLSIIGNKASIVQGPPGTGKSETICNLLCHFAANGKKVLFVSQKSQALKVVKDKLKNLGIKYLFGYIPNLASEQIGEIDEVDGIAQQLNNLNTYIEKINDKQMNIFENNNEETNHSIESIQNDIEGLKNEFNKLIDEQRKYYELYHKFRDYLDFDIPISNLDLFRENLTKEKWNELIKLKNEIENISKLIDEYQRNSDKDKFDKEFSKLFFPENYYEYVKRYKDDIFKTGYDGHSKILRYTNNLLRKIRIYNIRNKIPREIRDHIDNILDSDKSRNEQYDLVNKLCNYFNYRYNCKKIIDLEKKFKEYLNNYGITEEAFLSIEQLANRNNYLVLNDIKQNILEVYEIKEKTNKISENNNNPNKLYNDLKNKQNEKNRRIASYIQNIINQKILNKWSYINNRRIIQHLARAFQQSRRIFKSFDDLRKEPDKIKNILDLIPVWIMELDDASRFLPLEPAIFDYLILDEASQCNIAYTLPTMYRAKKAIFVGDSEQMRDNTILFKPNRAFDELAQKYEVPDDFKIKATGMAVQSILDIAVLHGFRSITLRNHYRSPAELIGFCNKYFYLPKGKELIPRCSNYITYNNTNKIIIVHNIVPDNNLEFADRINVTEANKILEIFKQLREDIKYQDKSIGILTFFNDQATYIRNIFEKEGFNEDKHNFKIGIIESIQGDEKDIIFYSFVIRSPDQKNRYVPLTGEGGDIRVEINKGRVNVAFSRARLQVHVFTSLSVENMPEGIWLKKYLEYAEENGKINPPIIEIFESKFEEEFYNHAVKNLGNEFMIENQVRSCKFRIDFVITNLNNSKKIAIECDGPTHFQDFIDEELGIYKENDIQRQQILEAAGWQFYRIKYSDWVNDKYDKTQIFNEIRNMLQ